MRHARTGGYARYFVVGLGLRSRQLSPGSEWLGEEIEEFRIDEYRMAGGKLSCLRRGELLTGNYWFTALSVLLPANAHSYVLVHDGPIAIGSGDFPGEIES